MARRQVYYCPDNSAGHVTDDFRRKRFSAQQRLRGISRFDGGQCDDPSTGLYTGCDGGVRCCPGSRAVPQTLRPAAGMTSTRRLLRRPPIHCQEPGEGCVRFQRPQSPPITSKLIAPDASSAGVTSVVMNPPRVDHGDHAEPSPTVIAVCQTALSVPATNTSGRPSELRMATGLKRRTPPRL